MCRGPGGIQEEQYYWGFKACELETKFSLNGVNLNCLFIVFVAAAKIVIYYSLNFISLADCKWFLRGIVNFKVLHSMD